MADTGAFARYLCRYDLTVVERGRRIARGHHPGIYPLRTQSDLTTFLVVSQSSRLMSRNLRRETKFFRMSACDCVHRAQWRETQLRDGRPCRLESGHVFQLFNRREP